MEKQQERVLAYKLAKEIDHDQLSDVSGGSWMTSRMTFGPTGSSGSQDGHVDVVVDF